jgi:hypothetical protein
MNDEELEQRLRTDIQELVRPPYGAPDTLRRRVASLDILEPIRHRGGHGVLVVPRVFRKPRVLAAAAVVALLIGSAMAFHPTAPHPGNSANLPATFDMFGRIDANSAWLERGSDLYITRDGGGTWVKGSIPGGSLEGQAIAPTAADSGTAEPLATTSSGPGVDHLYPVFIDANHGWLLSWTVANGSDCQVGDWSLTVWRTADGGLSWQSSQLPGTYKGYGSVQFTDLQHGWVTITRVDSAYSCSKQSDGGDGTPAFNLPTTVPVSGLATPAPTPTPAPLPDDETTVLTSADGGVTWSRTSTLSEMVFLSFTGSQEAWGYGISGTGLIDLVVHSVDGARTWTKSELSLPAGMSAAGIGQQPATDGSRLTLRLEVFQNGALTNLGSDTPNAPYAAPTYEILTLVSDDGGTTWRVDATRAIPGDFPNILPTGSSMLTPSAQSQPIAVADNNWVSGGGVSLGQTTSALADTFQATFDGGISWLSYSTKGLPGMIGMAQWVSSDDVWVMSSAGSDGSLGGSGYIYTTRDGGKTWTALGGAPSWPASFEPTATPLVVGPDYTDQIQTQPQAYASIESIGRVDANVGWAAINSQSGFELRMTGNGGTTWSEPHSLPSMGQIQFVDANRGWLVESGDVVGPAQSLMLFSTGDGGNSWEQISVDMGSFPDVASSPGAFAAANNVHFRDALHGELFAVVSYPPASNAPDVSQWQSTCRQSSTADGGATWSAARDGPCLGQATFTDSLNGYAQGLTGGRDVFITSDGGQTWVQGQLPGADSSDLSDASILLLDRHPDGSLDALVQRSGSITLATSADGGKTWADSGASLGLSELGSGYQFAQLGENNWIALPTDVGPVTAPVGWETFDAGRTWTQMWGAGLESVSSVVFEGSTSGWALGYPSVCQPSGNSSEACQIEYNLLATSDGGQSWGQILAP